MTAKRDPATGSLRAAAYLGVRRMMLAREAAPYDPRHQDFDLQPRRYGNLGVHPSAKRISTPREEVEFLRTIARSLGVEHAKPEPATRLVDRHEVASMFGISVKTHERAA